MIPADPHLSDEEVVRHVDEGSGPEAGRASEHLARCEACRARIAGVETLLVALRAEPPAATEGELSAQRERILALVRSRPRGPVGVKSRRTVWVPAIAAAAIATLVLWAPRGTRPPGTDPTANISADSSPLPVVIEATRAAEEVVEAAGSPAVGELARLSSTDVTPPDGAVSSLDDWNGEAELERQFAELPREDREAILTELASLSWDP